MLTRDQIQSCPLSWKSAWPDRSTVTQQGCIGPDALHQAFMSGFSSIRIHTQIHCRLSWVLGVRNRQAISHLCRAVATFPGRGLAPALSATGLQSHDCCSLQLGGVVCDKSVIWGAQHVSNMIRMCCGHPGGWPGNPGQPPFNRDVNALSLKRQTGVGSLSTARYEPDSGSE
jgi:hypothetical protein